MQNFLNLHFDKTRKTHDDKKTLFNHAFYKTKFKPKLFTAEVKCNGTVIKLPKRERAILFFKFKFLLNGNDLIFWFAFDLAVHFRPKIALTLEIPSSKAY